MSLRPLVLAATYSVSANTIPELRVVDNRANTTVTYILEILLQTLYETIFHLQQNSRHRRKWSHKLIK